MRSRVLPIFFVGICLAAIFSGGCATRRVSTTSRTAIEQLLLSTAVDKALLKLDLPMLKGHKVFMDFHNLKGTDVEYLQVAMRAKIAQEGSILVSEAEKADYVMEIASGALAMEDENTLVGMPALPVPQSPVATPEMSLFKSSEQTAIFKLLIFVHKEGQFVARDLYFAKGSRDDNYLLWYRFQRKDDVREGWEKADDKLAEKSSKSAPKDSEPVATVPNGPQPSGTTEN